MCLYSQEIIWSPSRNVWFPTSWCRIKLQTKNKKIYQSELFFSVNYYNVYFKCSSISIIAA